MSRPNSSIDSVDLEAFMNEVIAADTQEQFERILVRFAFNADPKSSIVYGIQWLRRRSVRRTDYVPTASRLRREGIPFTYVENMVLKWAKDWRREGKQRPTNGYLADMLQRTEAEVTEYRREMDNMKDGIYGFDFGETNES